MNAFSKTVQISAPDLREVHVKIIGVAPLMVARFSEKAKEEIKQKHAAGSSAKKGQTRAKRDFDADFNAARHISQEGWDGIHAGAFRAALISACRLVGFRMTLAKLSLFVVADGYDCREPTPLIRIHGPQPQRSEMHVRNATGVVDIRIRPVWNEWFCMLRVRYDAQQFNEIDVLNLLSRAGLQVGIGEGRPDSRESVGLGYGLFRLEQEGDN